MAEELHECDLVMKGGITSGVVYPGVVVELARKYRFRSIGGTSAGAIAAAICAAAEYGRQRGEGGGMDQLEAAVDDLTQPGFLLGLFQPTEPARPLFETILAALPCTSRWSRLETLGRTALQRRPLPGIAAVLLLGGLAAITGASFAALPLWLAIVLAAVIALPIALLVIVCAQLVALGLLGVQTVRSLADSDYGICPGSRQRGTDEALAEWLHRQIQLCAGLPPDGVPLTLGDLKKQSVELRMMTTDLSFARPVVIPDGLKGYLFDPKEMRERFPEAVVDAMVGDGDGIHTSDMPTDGLPVVVAARLSLSFPGLLSAMPLYSPDPRSEPQDIRHLFSDGGIASNFPLQFFDAWFPHRPTFGIDLADHPAGEAPVFMPPGPKESMPPRWHDVRSVGAFVGQIKDTMQNWRDSMQMELPSYRDRVCQIRLTAGEGGLNLNMDADVIAALIARGHQAGQKILETFDDAEWTRHRFVRYLVLMQMLQENLAASGPPLLEFAGTLPAARSDGDYPRAEDWRRLAATATDDLIKLGNRWGPPPAAIDFGGADTPVPVGVMRIVPNA